MSIIDHLRRSYRAARLRAGPVRDHGSCQVRRTRRRRGQLVPGLVVYRFASGLYYANSTRFNEEILGLVDDADPASPVRCVVLEASAIVDVDYSGGLTLKQVCGELHDRGVRFVIADVADEVRPELDRFEITEAIGADGYYETVGEAVDAFQGTGS